MAFNLKTFRDENKGYFGDTPLKDIASQIYSSHKLQNHGFASADDWALRMGFDKDIEEEERLTVDGPRLTVDQGPDFAGHPSRGALRDVAASIGRGVMGVPEMGLHAAAGVDEIVDKWVGEAGGFDLKTWARKKADEVGKYKEEALPVSQETLSGGFRRSVTGGVESAITSLAVKGPAAAAGFVLTGGPWGAILGWLSGVPMFGAAQYDEALLEYRKQGLSEDDAQAGALMEGGSEMGFELFSDVIEIATLGSGGVLSAPVKSALKNSVAKILKGSWKEAVKRGAVIAGAETTGELLNVGTQAEIRESYGIGDQRFWGAVKDSLGPVAVASLIFGTLGGGFHLANINKVKKALEDPGIDKEVRLGAVREVAKAIDRVSPELAERWTETAFDTVQRGEAIPIEEQGLQFTVDGSQSTDNREPETGNRSETTPDGPLETNAKAVSDIGKDEGVEERRDPGVEEERLTVDGSQLPVEGIETESGTSGDERLTSDEGQEIEELGAGLSDGQVDFVRDKVRELGSVEAVEEAFPADDQVGRYAKKLAVASYQLPVEDIETESGTIDDERLTSDEGQAVEDIESELEEIEAALGDADEINVLTDRLQQAEGVVEEAGGGEPPDQGAGVRGQESGIKEEGGKEKVSVKFMITKADEAELRKRGYTDEQIGKLKPVEVGEILKEEPGEINEGEAVKEVEAGPKEALKYSRLSAQQKVAFDNAVPVLDEQGNETGWGVVEDVDLQGQPTGTYGIVNKKTDEVRYFKSENTRSGTENMRASAQAKDYAIENRTIDEERLTSNEKGGAIEEAGADKVKVKTRTVREATGETVIVEETAKEALDRIDAQSEGLLALLECL